MRDGVIATLGVATVALIGTAYVLVHERRRKQKPRRRTPDAEGAAGDEGALSDNGKVQGAASAVSREKLISILEASSVAAYQLVEQTRKMVYTKHEQTGVSFDKAVEELQKDFEQAMETVVMQIRRNHNVSEAQMSQAMLANQTDPDVQIALTGLREAMSGKAPPSKPVAAAAETKRPVRRNGKPRQRKG